MHFLDRPEPALSMAPAAHGILLSVGQGGTKRYRSVKEIQYPHYRAQTRDERLTRHRTRANTIDDARSDDSTRSEIHQAPPVRPTRAPAHAGLTHPGPCITAEV